MWRRRAALPALLPALAVAGFNEGVEFDAYRAVSYPDMRFTRMENVDFADLPGLVDYLHTKVILEHPIELDTEKNKVETEERTSRVNSIDTLVRLRMKVKNPDTMMAGKQVRHVDFGPWAQFVEGQATGDVYKWDYGDFVGVQKHIDDRFDTDLPYYWFSLSGFCPNLPFREKKVGLNQTANENCVNYKDGSGTLLGGFCPAKPTGKPGCTYSFDAPQVPSPNVLSLDDLAGITSEDCGEGRKCKNWMDFRSLCTNKEYKKKFQYSRRRRFRGKKIVETSVCVEYDIDPDCVHDCNSHACKRIPEEEREIGLPFWRGRCNKQANQARFEAVAKAFGIPGATTAHNLITPMTEPITCVNQYHTQCQPFTEFGGMYCTRTWGGICQECRIPNAVKTPEKTDGVPWCPWDVLQIPDYSAPAFKPQCASGLPRQLCCIYAGTCNVTATSPETAPLNDDGYWLVVSQKSTEAVQSYLTRAVQKKWSATVTDPDGVAKVAYNEWGLAPIRGRNLELAMHDMKPYIFIPPTTTTTPLASTSALADLPITTSAVLVGTTIALQQEVGTPIPSWVWWLLAGGIATCVVCGLLGFFVFSFFGDQERRKSGDGRLSSMDRPTRKSQRAEESRKLVAAQAPAEVRSPAILAASGSPVPLVQSQQVQYVQTAVVPNTSQQGYIVMAPQQGLPGQQVVYVQQ